jgi:hypothetical protein
VYFKFRVRKFMKLFKSLLVAPATLGLLAPMSATANEVTISDFTPAEQLAITNSRVDGLEARLNNIEAGSFSETTTASFSVDFAIGAVDGSGISTGVTEGTEQVQATYGFQIDLNTSFTGEDSLDVSLDAGNANGTLSEFDLNGPDESLTVDGVSYTFPVGDSITAIVGDNTDGSAMFTTACAYGGPSNTLDDCGNVNAGFTNGGFMVGAVYDFDNGFTVATGFAGPETGIAIDASADAYGFNAAYTDDNYGLSVTYGMLDSHNGADTPVPDGEVDTYTAFNAYYSFDNGLSLSGGYEFGDLGGVADTSDGVINYFVGISAPAGPGEIGGAFGTSGGQTEGVTEELMYEAYYSYPLNDGMTITPLVYVKEQATAGTPDQTGIMVKTSFSF